MAKKLMKNLALDFLNKKLTLYLVAFLSLILLTSRLMTNDLISVFLFYLVAGFVFLYTKNMSLILIISYIITLSYVFCKNSFSREGFKENNKINSKTEGMEHPENEGDIDIDENEDLSDDDNDDDDDISKKDLDKFKQDIKNLDDDVDLDVIEGYEQLKSQEEIDAELDKLRNQGDNQPITKIEKMKPFLEAAQIRSSMYGPNIQKKLDGSIQNEPNIIRAPTDKFAILSPKIEARNNLEGFEGFKGNNKKPLREGAIGADGQTKVYNAVHSGYQGLGETPLNVRKKMRSATEEINQKSRENQSDIINKTRDKDNYNREQSRRQHNARVRYGFQNNQPLNYTKIKHKPPKDNIPKKINGSLTKAEEMEAAYDNFEQVMGKDNIKSLGNTTTNLISKQKELLGGIKEMAPVLEKAMDVLNKFDFSSFTKSS